MSVAAFEWVPFATEAQTSLPVERFTNHSREDEFRVALDSYMADYAAGQERRIQAIRSTAGTQSIIDNATRSGGRRPLTAIREIWLFSHELFGDWRQSRERRPD